MIFLKIPFINFIIFTRHIIYSYTQFTIPYYQGDYSYRIPLSLGKHQKEPRIAININSQFSYITCRVEDEFLLSPLEVSSKQCTPIFLEISNKTFNALPNSNPISYIKIKNTQYELPDQYLVDLSYYIIENTSISSTEVNSLAFAYTFNDTKHSLIHQLKNKGLIDRLSFTFIKEDALGGLLYLGSFPHKTISNLYHSYCNIIGNKHRWDCSISQIKLYSAKNETVYNVSKELSYVYFDTAISYIYAPKHFLDSLYNYYFRSAILHGDCFIYKSRGTGQIACEDYVIDKMGNITFVIGDFAYDFNIWQFWFCGDICYFEMLLNQNGDYWILGTEFLHPYSITFDYDNKRIDFYSKGNVWKVTEEKMANTLKIYFILLGIVLFLGLIINSFTVIKIKGDEICFYY